MPIAIPNAVEVTIHGTQAGNKVENTFNWLVEATPVSSRTHSIEALQDQLIPGWSAWVNNLSNTYRFTGWTMVDLDELDGRVWTRGASVPGGQSGPPLPSNVAGRVIRNSERRRGFRQGSFYLGGLLEDNTDGNRFTTAAYNGLQDQLDTLRSAWTETGLVADYRYQLCTVHNVAGDVATSVVTSFTLEQGLSHQDRRIRNR